MNRVLCIFGTRPEAIKMAPVIKELERKDGFHPIVCVTAQHRQMLDQVLSVFKIKPDYDLNIMKQGQTLSDITCAAMRGLETVLIDTKPDLVLVHGDTTTSFVGALAAFYHHTPIGHVEAGLRTYCKYSPYPEEMNRQMTDRLSDLCFAPTELSKNNLLLENIPETRIFVTGNTVIDAMATTVKPDYSHPFLDKLGDQERLILLTAHRRENLGEPMRRIFHAVKHLVDVHPDIHVLYPVHMNPQIRVLAESELSGCNRIHLMEPLDVFDCHNFMNKATLILTDSGGIQEEAPALGKPVLVLRDTTERPEGIEAGTLKLVGTDEELIFSEASKLLQDPIEYARMSNASNPYGDGQASRRIADVIGHFLLCHGDLT